MNIRVSPKLYVRLESMADCHGVTVPDLVRMWMGQRLIEEELRICSLSTLGLDDEEDTDA